MRKIFILLFVVVFNLLPAQANFGILSGWIVDDITAEPLETVQVIVSGTDIGTITDRNGYFYLRLNPGKSNLAFTMVGYETDSSLVEVKQDKTKKLHLYLKQKTIEQQPINVTGFRKRINFSPMDMDLDIRTLSSRPVLGEVDVFRIVQNLPSVTYTNDFSGLIYIRGSNFDQTRITYDDVPILNPYHLGGAFSSFNADGVKTVEFSPGIYSAEQGGYLGGRLNIIPKDGGIPQRYHNKVSFGLLSSKFSYGKMLGNHSFFLAARRTYFDLVELLFSQEYGPYYFYDAQAAYKYKLNESNMLSINYFFSRDVFSKILEYDEEGVNGLIQPAWGNQVVSLKWSHSPNLKFNAQSHLYLSKGISFSNTNHIDVDIQQNIFGLKQNFNFINRKHYVSFGFNFDKLLYQGKWNINNAQQLANIVGIAQYMFFDYAPAIYSYKDEGYQLTGYIQDTYNLNAMNKISGGIRFGWNKLAEKYFILPRLQYIRDISPNNSLTVNYSQNEQNYYTLKTANFSGISAPFSAFFAVKADEKSLESHNFAVGYRGILPKSFTLRLEAYYKNARNIPAVNRYGVHEILYNKQNSAGLDLLVEREVKDGISLNSSYSLNFISIERDKEKITAPYERRHTFYNEVSYLSKNGWQFGLRWNFMTGLPYTPLVGVFVGAGTDEQDITHGNIWWDINYANNGNGRTGTVYGKENSQNFPPYHRMDINISKAWYLGNTRLWLKFQIMNVYNRKNPIEYRYEFSQDLAEKDNFNNFPVLPSFELEWEF